MALPVLPLSSSIVFAKDGGHREIHREDNLILGDPIDIAGNQAVYCSLESISFCLERSSAHRITRRTSEQQRIFPSRGA